MRLRAHRARLLRSRVAQQRGPEVGGLAGSGSPPSALRSRCGYGRFAPAFYVAELLSNADRRLAVWQDQALPLPHYEVGAATGASRALFSYPSCSATRTGGWLFRRIRALLRTTK